MPIESATGIINGVTSGRGVAWWSGHRDALAAWHLIAGAPYAQ